MGQCDEEDVALEGIDGLICGQSGLKYVLGQLAGMPSDFSPVFFFASIG